MTKKRGLWGSLFRMCAALSCLPALASAANAANPLPSSLQLKVDNLRSDLSSKGFEVAQGDFHLFNIEDCKYAIATIGNCLGNNPAAPYIIPTLPMWPDEHVDSHMKDLLGPVASNMGWTYRVDKREAIVILGVLPPKARYFGLQSYIFSREGAANPGDEIYRNLSDNFMKSILFMSSPNPARPLVVASVGDSVNNVVIERQSGASFGEQRFFVLTPDAALGREINAALLKAGVPESSHILTEPISPSLARLGLESSADDFMTIIRYALPNDEAAGNEWRRQLPLTLLRIRDKNASKEPEFFAQPAREVRTARSELGLESSVDALVTAVKQKWAQPEVVESKFGSLLLNVDLIGEHCLMRPMNCLGDIADADYQISETASVDSGEVLAVAGTLATTTGNATYTSLSVNRLPELVGSGNVTDVDLKGTASSYASTVANTEKLYVHYYARDCRNLSACLEITEEMVPRGDKLKLIQRNYVAPGSARGPDPKLVVNPRLIVFKRQ